MFARAAEQILHIMQVHAGFLGLAATLGIEQIQNAFALGFFSHFADGGLALVENPPAKLTISVQVHVVSRAFFGLTQHLVSVGDGAECLFVSGGRVVGVVALGEQTVHAVNH